MTYDKSPTVDFFTHEALPAPRLTADEAGRIAAEHFGLTVRAESLGSQQDANFLLTAQGTPVAVLKIANPAFTATEIDAQDMAADLIADSQPGLRLATVLRDAGGKRRIALVPADGGPVTARLLRYLPGGTLSGPRHLSPRTVAAMGRVAGQVSNALRSFEHPGLERVLQWDPRHADRVVARLLDHVAEAERRSAVLAATTDAWAAVVEVADRLPRQAVHLDLTDDNLVRSPDSTLPLPDGIIDLGDLTDSWAVCELAVSLSSVLHHDGVQPHNVLPAVRAFHEIRPLSTFEVAALWPLVVLRAATLVVSGRHQAAVDGDNAYVHAALDREWRIFQQATAVPTAVMTHLITEALGLIHDRVTPAEPALPVLAELDPAGIAVLDLSVGSDTTDHGAWLAEAADDHLAAALLSEGAATVATHYGQARLTAAPALSTASPATIATGVDLWLDGPAVLQAPGDGELLAAVPGHAAVTFGPHVLHLSFPDTVAPIPPTDIPLRAGEPLVALPAGARVHVSLQEPGAPTVPALVRPEYAAGWLALTADPTPLIGLPAAGSAPDGDLLARRDAVFATVQEHYYDNPPRIERGWRHHLVSTEGRSYLDMVNNVTPLGHAHPRIEQAVARQVRKLNTNSRFHYAAVVEFAERLAALLPDPLDTVFLVNSGSEAVDLAIRLAIGATGQHEVVALREAYHGWTYASDAVSTSLQDNPNALATRPRWVHTVDSPNSYRGRWRDEQAGNYAPEAVQVIDRMAASGHPAGAFLSESFYGNAGGVALPDGYLQQVYAAVRRHGGLAIADEIQVGYGRLGSWFWGFEQQQVVPDVVCVAKAMGNGHPLGAVITTRAIADRYRDQGYFFSSTGGSPVSSIAGLTVLDTLRDEDLQGNAVRTGARLKDGLQALATRHGIIGAVHGSGLYLGLELVRDHTTLEPATEETAELCDRMLDLGVIVQPTGDHLNILKIKPPLCIDPTAVDFFTHTLDRALTELAHDGTSEHTP
ncbi:aminotransferase [Streptomyces sp. ME02-8801-2C]|uniref:aminotransferase n=1 Tax=Streptomyces sp. ME02-8801-2C TaxID=3028680 RepID=UPI0029BDFF9B|nr:aminotransferase [Streptomyces sp. ME02-8801-2C]MDX3452614.1 aminotransferase [Streptomyces sp. ME02-8801-2C]